MATRRQTSPLALTASGTAIAPSWPAATLAGSLLVGVVYSRDSDESPVWTPPSGWTLAVASTPTADTPRTLIYRIENAASRSGAESFSHGGVAKPLAAWVEEWEPGAGETITFDEVASAVVAGGGSADRPTGATPTTGGATIQVGGVANRNGSRTLTSIQDLFTERVNGVTGTGFTNMVVAGGSKAEAAAEAGATGWTVSNVSGSNASGAIAAFLVEEAGGTAHTEEIDDTVSLADQLVRTAEFARTIPDTVALADAQALARGVALADTLDLADDVVTATGKGVTIDDTVAIADALALGRGLFVADTAALADEIALARSVAIADSVALADSAALARGLGIADSLGVADQLAFARALLIADSLAVADSVSAGGAGSHSVQIDDAVALADALTRFRGVTLEDTVTVDDDLELARSLLLADSLALSDLVTFARTLALADGVSVADAISTGGLPPHVLATAAVAIIRADARVRVVRAEAPAAIVTLEGDAHA